MAVEFPKLKTQQHETVRKKGIYHINKVYKKMLFTRRLNMCPGKDKECR
jgi:hypothetical protein